MFVTFSACSSSNESSNYNRGYESGYSDGYIDGQNEFKEGLSSYDGLERAFLDSSISDNYVYIYDHILLDDVISEYIISGRYRDADAIKNLLLNEYDLSEILGYAGRIMDLETNTIHGSNCEKLKKVSTRYMLFEDLIEEEEWNSYNTKVCPVCNGEFIL